MTFTIPALIRIIKTAIGKWLDRTVNIIKSDAATHERARKTTITSSRVDTTSTITVTGEKASQSFDKWVDVPIGGFRPRFARAFAMQKPEGIVFRSRTYVKYGGQTVRMKGFMTDPIDHAMARPNCENLAGTVGQTAAEGLADVIISEFQKHGVTAIKK